MGHPASFGLLDAYDHGVGTDEGFHARLAEAPFLHPPTAVPPGIAEAAGSCDQHVEAHQQTEGVLRPFVVDEGFVDDVSAAWWECFISLADQHFLLFELPVVKEVSHHDDLHLCT